MLAAFIKSSIAHLMLRFFSLFPIDKDKIVFSSFYGMVNDNPYAIYKKLCEKNVPCKCVWLVSKGKRGTEKTEYVGRLSVKGCYHLATARVWIDNSRKREWVCKRKGQFYIQTWHGGIGNKLVEKAAASKLSDGYVKEAIHDSEMIDLFLSNSAWMTNIIKRDFWYDGPVKETGYPREDILFDKTGKMHRSVCAFYHVDPETRFVIYAPTFRNDPDMDYGFDTERLVNTFQNKYGGVWKIIIRLHPNVLKEQHKVHYSDNVLNGSEYPDMNELIMASEWLISDYSSCMFDALIAGRSVMAYVKDLEKYREERGFIVDPEKLPFPIARDEDDMNCVVENFDWNKFQQEGKRFLADCGMVQDGKASERVADLVCSLLKEG